MNDLDIYEIALQVRKVRDAILAKDMDLAYKELLKIADPTGESENPWEVLEIFAKQGENNAID